MRKLKHFGLSLAILLPLATQFAQADSNSLPDGTYKVKVMANICKQEVIAELVEAVSSPSPTLLDPTYIQLWAGRDSVDFTNVKPGDELEISTIKGSVMVFSDLGETK